MVNVIAYILKTQFQRGTYNTTVVPGVKTGYKMYNHTCFEMDTQTGQNVPFMFTR